MAGDNQVSNPKISIIVPVYNGAAYVKKFCHCLKSQEYSDFEVIFVNDGSQDNSLSLLQQSAENFSNAVVISQENRGVSAARNAGIKVSKGDWICFCDIDDQISNNYLETFVNVIDITFGDVILSSFKIVKRGEPLPVDSTPLEVHTETSSETLTKYLKCQIECGVCGGMIKGNLVRKNNLLFAEGYQFSEDLHFMWRTLALSTNVSFINKSLYFYMWDGTSATSSFDKRRFQGFELMSGLCDFIREHRPDFYENYKKHVPARLMWSIARQASSRLSYNEFVNLFADYDVMSEMEKLYDYPSLLVKISARLYMLSPLLFYVMVGAYGKKTINS